jgi:two-component system, chemotaxis family, protein-glutamate methylesterase/glutaminase
MDIEMPVMDGISAVRKIMAQRPTPVVMFSSLTSEGAKATLDALDAGAADFLPKRFEDIAKDKDQAKRLLCEKVHALGKRGAAAPAPRPAAAPRTPGTPVAGAKPAPFSSAPLKPKLSASVAAAKAFAPSKGSVKLLLIGTSTGGPVALQKVLTLLPENFPVPVLVVQHMPGTFTPAFSQRLDQACNVRVKQAADGDVLMPGSVYIAPGGRQMILDPRASAPTLRIVDGDPSLNYKPSVDVTFGSVSKVFAGPVLAVIMTGMGADGREGARALKTKGAEVWAQDEKSCVVYGMPAAIVDAGLADRVYDLANIGENIIHKVM